MVPHMGRMLRLGSMTIVGLALVGSPALAKGHGGGGGGHGGGGHGGGHSGGHSGGGHHSGGSGHHSGGYVHHGGGGYVHHGGGYVHHGYTNNRGYYGGYSYWPNFYFGSGYYGNGYYNNGYYYGNGYGYSTPYSSNSYYAPTVYRTTYAAVPNIGVSEQAVTDADGQGVMIMAVTPGSAGARAGLQVGDVMHIANGYLIQQPGNLRWVAERAQGGTISLQVKSASDGQNRVYTLSGF